MYERVKSATVTVGSQEGSILASFDVIFFKPDAVAANHAPPGVCGSH